MPFSDRDSHPPIIVWFRRDLRLDDHPPLAEAVASGRPIVPVVVLDPRLRRLRGPGRRLERFDAAVAALDRDLRARGGRLVVRTGDPASVIPALAAEVGAREVVASRDLTPYARRRDDAVARSLGGQARLRLLPGTLVIEPEATGETRVFAAFHRRWLVSVRRPLAPAPGAIVVPDGVRGEALPTTDAAGGPEALHRLAAFERERAAAYRDDRNRLDIDGTSGLSTDLHLGTLSPLRAALTESEAFVRQLAWRDWAHHLLWFDGFRDDLSDEPAWREDPGGFDAWREGRTGYPAVDAAMRQLAETGWLHNRARMIAASFLTKDLLVDWRAGEAHFREALVDADVANNRLGWRWTSGVGADAAPFVRVFNPSLQGERFDPQGAWVRRWVPEVAALPPAFVHRPWDAPVPPAGYPRPIVDHAAARHRALAAFAARRVDAGRRGQPHS